LAIVEPIGMEFGVAGPMGWYEATGLPQLLGRAVDWLVVGCGLEAGAGSGVEL